MSLKSALYESQVKFADISMNRKIADFAKLFITKVINAPGEVSFENRLELENAVRNLKNEEILANWQMFVESKTESEAKRNVKILLENIVNNI